MTYQELLSLARACEGEILKTSTGKEFRVGIYVDCPFFIPLSTGQGRSSGRKAVEGFLERFNQTGSLRQGDYNDLTRDASYLVALVQTKT